MTSWPATEPNPGKPAVLLIIVSSFAPWSRKARINCCGMPPGPPNPPIIMTEPCGTSATASLKELTILFMGIFCLLAPFYLNGHEVAGLKARTTLLDSSSCSVKNITSRGVPIAMFSGCFGSRPISLAGIRGPSSKVTIPVR